MSLSKEQIEKLRGCAIPGQPLPSIGEFLALCDQAAKADEYLNKATEEGVAREHAVKERDRLAMRLLSHKEFYGQRYDRLFVWAHERLPEDLKTEYFNIVANGTATLAEHPTYAQQFNVLKWERDEAVRLLAEAKQKFGDQKEEL